VGWLVEQPLLAFFVVWAGLQSGTQIKLKHATNPLGQNRKTGELLAIEEF
jgi:hypothetical protein